MPSLNTNPFFTPASVLFVTIKIDHTVNEGIQFPARITTKHRVSADTKTKKKVTSKQISLYL